MVKKGRLEKSWRKCSLYKVWNNSVWSSVWKVQHFSNFCWFFSTWPFIKFVKKFQILEFFRTTFLDLLQCNFIMIQTSLRCSNYFNDDHRYNEDFNMTDNHEPFGCKLCKKRFKVKSSCIRHIRRHDDRCKIKCRLCEFTTTRSEYLTPILGILGTSGSVISGQKIQSYFFGFDDVIPDRKFFVS